MLGLCIGSTSRAQLAPLYHLPLATSLKYVLFDHVGFVWYCVEYPVYYLKYCSALLSAMRAVLMCGVWIWLGSIIRAPVTFDE